MNKIGFIGYECNFIDITFLLVLWSHINMIKSNQSAFSSVFPLKAYEKSMPELTFAF